MITKKDFEEARNRMEVCNSEVDWEIEDCQIVDRFCKQEALRVLEERIRGIDKDIRNYVLCMCDYHFGSVETDALLLKLGCYNEEYVVKLNKDKR